MRIRIKNPIDFGSGLMFVAFGAVGFVEARHYSLGSLLNMGPAYFPTLLSVILTLIGAVIALRALRTEGDAMPEFRWRGPVLLSLAFLCFGLFMDTLSLGFAASVLSVIVLSALADRDSRPVQVAVLALLLTAFAVTVFVFGLGLPYPLFWWR